MLQTTSVGQLLALLIIVQVTVIWEVNCKETKRRLFLNPVGGKDFEETGDGIDEEVDNSPKVQKLIDLLTKWVKVNESEDGPLEYGGLTIPKEYNKLKIGKPTATQSATWGVNNTLTGAFLNLRGIQDVDEINEEITLEMDLVIRWIDWGLTGNLSYTDLLGEERTLNSLVLKKIWTPDIFMDDLKGVSQPVIMTRPVTLKFMPGSGFLSYTSRLIVTLGCQMDFTFYPADTQNCTYILRSYAYDEKDFTLIWRMPGVFLHDTYDPNYDLQVSDVMSKQINDTLNTVQTLFGKKHATYDVLQFSILTRRKLSFHLVQTYLFSMFFVIISFLCFLIPTRMVETRIGILMTTLLTLTALFASIRSDSPAVSYVKAIDVWMLSCIVFVFLILLQCAVSVFLRKFIELQEEKQTENVKKVEKIRKLKYIVEKWALPLFVAMFIAFNCWHWTWLLGSSGYFQWEVNPVHNGEWTVTAVPVCDECVNATDSPPTEMPDINSSETTLTSNDEATTITAFNLSISMDFNDSNSNYDAFK